MLRDALLLGAMAILLPIAKGTGFALLPIVAVAVAAIALHHGARAAARWTAAVAASAAVTLMLWVFAFSPLMGGGRGDLVNVHPPVTASVAATMSATTTPTPPAAPEPLSLSLVGRAQYFVQTFVPAAPFGERRWQIAGPTRLSRWPAFVIYIDRGYGLFGWKSTSISYEVKRSILFALALGWGLALVAAFRARRQWRSWLGGVVILGGALLGVLAFVSYAYTSAQIQTEPGEQGRYVFTAMVPLAVLLSCALTAFRGRLAQIAFGAGVSAAWVLAVVAWTSALRGWFT